MSWIRNSPLRGSLVKRSTHSPPKDCDPTACYDSFRKHWQQIYDIAKKTQPPKYYPNQDDVLSVVNHLDQMETILLLELKSSGSNPDPSCLEYLLVENILDKLFVWSLKTGKYSNIMKQEQLKLYEMLISNSGHELIGREPVARPLLKLLDTCTDYYPVELERRLVILLNQLCVSLLQNMELLGLFFTPSTDRAPAKFMIFSLLIPFIHKEGAIGQQARDALLLCMTVSKKNESVGLYIAENSNICQFLATGLSGLYSLLPRKLVIEMDDWHRFTTDDVNELDELNMFMNSLEFCNAIAWVAHPKVKAQLLKYLYQGFLVPVMGPALVQDTVGLSVESLDLEMEANNVEELIAATAYFDLFLRSITEPTMLYYFVKFLVVDEYEGERILNILIQRLGTKSRLCLVSLALFETLVDLNCEDVMLELVMRYLIPCTHVMLSQRKRVNDVSAYSLSAMKFLSLAPTCCVSLRTNSSALKIVPTHFSPVHPSNSSSVTYNDSLSPSMSNVSQQVSAPISQVNQHRRTASGSESYYTTSSKTDSLLGNYVMYILDAKRNVSDCAKACSCWAYSYDGSNPPHDALDKVKKEYCVNNQNGMLHGKSDEKHLSVGDNLVRDSLVAIPSVSNYEVVDMGEAKLKLNGKNIPSKYNFSEESCPNGKYSLPKNVSGVDVSQQNLLKDGSQISFGESSGYESFLLKDSSENTPENEPEEIQDCFKEDLKDQNGDSIGGTKQLKDNSSRPLLNDFVGNSSTDRPIDTNPSLFSRDLAKSPVESITQNYKKDGTYLDIYNATPNIGSFLEILLKKLEGMMFNDLYINLHLTGLISRLAVYPQPLLHSFLLNHSLVFQPSIRSLFQVLESLKHKIDSYLSKQENVDELIVQAQHFLITREEKLVNVRKHLSDAASVSNRRTSVPEPFIRGDSKRESFSSRLSSVFKRATAHNNSHEAKLQTNPDGSGYRYVPRLSWTKLESKEEAREVWSVVMCAVLLDEWLKELAAITQEHFVMSDSSFRDVT